MTYTESADGIARSIRTLAALDVAIAELELGLDAMSTAVDDVATRIDSDEFDGGRNVFKGKRHTGAVHNDSRLRAARTVLRDRQHERNAIRAEIRSLRAERRLWTDRTPLGMVEIARLLGYSADAPRQWKRRDILPTPAGSVSGTPYWWRADVLTWALSRGRTRMIVDVNDSAFDDEPVDEYPVAPEWESVA